MAFAFTMHCLLLLVAVSAAGVVPSVVMPRVAALSISSAATPPGGSAETAVAVELPRPNAIPPVTPTDARPEVQDLAEPVVIIEHAVQPPPPLTDVVLPARPRAQQSPEAQLRPATQPSAEPVQPPPPAHNPSLEPGPHKTPSMATPGTTGESVASTVVVVDSTNCDHPPVLAKVNWPRTPYRLFKGSFTVRVVVDAEGRLVSIEMTKGTGTPEWDADLLDALRKATFKAATEAGVPLACRHDFRVTFVERD